LLAFGSRRRWLHCGQLGAVDAYRRLKFRCCYPYVKDVNLNALYGWKP